MRIVVSLKFFEPQQRLVFPFLHFKFSYSSFVPIKLDHITMVVVDTGDFVHA